MMGSQLLTQIHHQIRMKWMMEQYQPMAVAPYNHRHLVVKVGPNQARFHSQASV